MLLLIAPTLRRSARPIRRRFNARGRSIAYTYDHLNEETGESWYDTTSNTDAYDGCHSLQDAQGNVWTCDPAYATSVGATAAFTWDGHSEYLLDGDWHASDYVGAQADETRWPVFIEQEGKVGHRWWLWVFLTDDSVVFRLDPSRSHDVPEGHFAADACAILMVDRYAS